MANEEILEALVEAATDKPPFCTETLTTSISLLSSTSRAPCPEPELEALAQACVPATFGGNTDDILDETYRKAGKMDVDNFPLQLNVEKLGIHHRICIQLLDAAGAKKTVRVQARCICDVNHNITLVESGHRVTPTCNLPFENRHAASVVPPSVKPLDPRDALSEALADPDFLPDGGYLSFGLSFQYPI
ncbi:hypothetical protein DXG01_008055 [Tephrocybe rancida]|nr:hypothetical protein DXG01_008055 [Tephrocybe rancida]